MLLYEGGEAWRFDEDAIAAGTRGVLRVLAHLAGAGGFAIAGTESFVDSGYRAEVFVTAVNRSGRPSR